MTKSKATAKPPSRKEGGFAVGQSVALSPPRRTGETQTKKQTGQTRLLFAVTLIRKQKEQEALTQVQE